MEGPRALKREELESAVELADRVLANGEKRMQKVYPLLLSEDNAENLRVFVDKGKVVSLVGMLPRELNIYGHKVYVGLIGSVGTYPEYRGKGLATKLLNDTEARAMKNGISLFYISGGRNLYKRFGAVNAGVFYTATISEKKENPEVRKATVGDVAKICEIHSRKPVKFMRYFDDFLKVFQTGHAVDKKAEYFIFKDSYAIFVERDGQPRVVEYGGDEREVLEIIKHVLSKSDHYEALIHFPGFSAFRVIMPEKKRRGFFGTVKILSNEMFFDQIKGYFLERLPKRRAEKLKEQLSCMDTPSLTKFLFGSIEGDPEIPADLEGVLPIPIPDYGADFI